MSQPRDPRPPEASPQPQPAPSPSTGPIPARPGYSAPPPVLAPSPGPPRAVQWSYWLWMVSFAIGLLVIGYSVLRFDQLHELLAEQVRAQRPDIGADLLNRIVDITLATGLGGSTGIIVVQLLFAVLMRARRNWARVLLAVTAVFGLVGLGFSLVTVDKRAQLALPVQALLVIAAIVLMFVPSAGAWFRNRRA